MIKLIKVKEIPDRCILWDKDVVIGVKGSTLPESYYNKICIKTKGNPFDYDLLSDDEVKSFEKMFNDAFDK